MADEQNEQETQIEEGDLNMSKPKGFHGLIYPALVIVFVLVSGFIYLSQGKKSGNDNVAKSCIEGTADCNDTSTTEPDNGSWKNYTNEDYGFTLNFNDDWKGLKVATDMGGSGVGSAAYIRFGVPTQSPNGDFVSDGYAHPLTLVVYPVSVWDQLAASTKNSVNYITKSDNYVYTYSQWKTPTDDLKDKNFEIRKVVASLILTGKDNSNKWAVYKGTGYTFQYPKYTTAGGTAPNSSLGTYDKPVKGIYAGFFVVVPLTDSLLRSIAEETVTAAINASKEPLPTEEMDGPGPIECKEEKFSNVGAKIKAVSCNGEGGAAFYALIDGPKTDLFMDGYSGGFGGDAPARIKSEDLPAFFASFKFE